MPVLVWFLIIPMALQSWLTRAGESPAHLALIFRQGVDLMQLFIACCILVLALITLWGWTCVLLLARRLIQSRAGRARASFRAVRKESFPLVLPLLLTSLLQGCLLFYRSLLFLVPLLLLLFLNPCHLTFGPGTPLSSAFERCPLSFLLLPLLLPAIFFYVRTFFFDIILVGEGRMYRAALKRSKEMTHGRVCRVAGTLLVLAALTLLPAFILQIIIEQAATPTLHSMAPFIADLVNAMLSALASLFFILAAAAYYGALREKREGRGKLR